MMSRNLRHKSQETPTEKQKKTARRNSTLTESTSDDDYAGVDAISDSEDGDEPDVEEVEEQAIIESADDDVQTPRPSVDDDQSSWDGFDTQEEILGENTQFFDDHFARGHAPDHDTEATVLNHGLSEEDLAAARRVHFEIPGYDAADESSDTDEDDVWPDLFVPQSSLDASFRKAIESNKDDIFGGSSDGESSYWDFRGEEAGLAVEADGTQEDADGSSSDGSAGSSGYETDDGETTEEDLPAAAQYVGPSHSVLRRPSTDSGSEEEVTIARRTNFRKQNGPFLGSWIRNPTKPFVLMDNKAKRLLIFKADVTPRRWSMDANNSRQTLGNLSSQQPGNSVESPIELSPMISNSGNVMMSAMSATNGNGNQAFGPPEAFFPFTSVDANGSIMHDSLESFDEEDDLEDENLWVLEDLVDFGPAASIEGGNEEDDATADPASTPARPTTSTSDDQTPLHPHVPHPKLVGSFRFNQDRHHLISRNKASQASLAFSGPLNQGTIRGIKNNRLAAANTPITPIRRQKSAKIGYASIPSSPLVQQSNKRKASNTEARSHKRSKSMV